MSFTHNDPMAAAIEKRIREMAIVDHLKLNINLMPGERSEVTLTSIEPFHLGGVEGDFLNGGIVLSMLDAAIASVCLYKLDGRRCGTIDLSTKIMRPAAPHGITCSGWVVRSQGRFVFAEAKLSGPGAELYASATGIVAALRR